MLITEKRLLQVAVLAACIVPIVAGMSGAVYGARMFGGDSMELDSHFRYLSGLLFGIGFSFLCLVPNIENNTVQFRLLTSIVVTGGMARLWGFFASGIPSHTMIFAIGMELVVTPSLCLWQQRVAKKEIKITE
jgi:hypothetical protein